MSATAATSGAHGPIRWAVSLLLLALAGSMPSSAAAGRTAQEDGPPSVPRQGDLTLGGEAGRVLVGLALRPGRPGDNEVLVHVVPTGGEDEAAALQVAIRVEGDARPVDPCGRACRRTVATLEGGEEVVVEVTGADGGMASFRLPGLPAPAADELLSAATARMRALDAYRVEETLGPLDPPLRGRYAFEAPDRMRFELNTGQVTIRVGQHAFTRRDPDEPWRIRSGPQLQVPSHIWDYPTEPAAVRRLGGGRVDGVDTDIVAFFLRAAGNPVWFRVWIDDQRLVHRAEMRAAGHFMDHRYHSFDEPVDVRRPVSRLAIVRHELLGSRPGWSAAAAALRVTWYVGALLAVGGAVFARWVLDARLAPTVRIRQLLAVVAGAGAVALVASVPVQVSGVTGGAGLLLPTRWESVVFSGFGAAAGAAALGLVVVLLAAPTLGSSAGNGAALAGGLLALAPLVLSGHTLTAEPVWAGALGNLVHLLAAAVWLGSLTMLAVGLRTWPQEHWGAAASTVARVSAVAMWSLLALVVPGVALAAVNGGTLAALAASPYGWVLAAKLVLVASVVGLGTYNRQRLVPALQQTPDDAMARLRATVKMETVILLVVLAATAVLVAMPLPSA